MVLRAALPTGLIVSKFEQHHSNRQGGQVPICFVPEVIPPPDEKSGKLATAKFKISPTVKKTYKVLLEGGSRALINYIKVHKTILSDILVEVKVVTARALMLRTGAKLRT